MNNNFRFFLFSVFLDTCVYMKRKFVSLFVFISLLFVMVSSVAASPISTTAAMHQADEPPVQNVVAKIYFTNQEELNHLASRYDILEVNHEQGYVLAILSPEGYASLQLAGFNLEVDESKTELLNQPYKALPGQGPDTIPGFTCYRTVEETYNSMQEILNDFPDLVDFFDIGNSWDKITPGGAAGFDILALRLTNELKPGDKPTFFLMAEIHAREYVTAETAMRYAEYLVQNYGADPDVTWLLDYFQVYIVTMTNPDGRLYAETGYLWRKNTRTGCASPNSRGVDLNRNHSFKWGGAGTNLCDETYQGTMPASEPETQAIQNYVMTLFPDQRGPGDNDPAPSTTTGTFITLHSYSQLVLWPWGWTGTDSPNHAQLQTLGRHLAYFNGYTPQQSNDLYPTTGTSDDWSYGTLGIASYTFEMGTDFFQSCGDFEGTIYPDNLNALLYAFKTARRPYQNPAGPDSLTVMASPAAALPGEQVLLTATANDTRYNGGEPTQNIAEAHYSIDNPSWIAGTVAYPMSVSDGSFNSKVENIQATIDTTGLSIGKHTIFVESKDVNNNWGVPSATFLYIIEPGVSPVIEGYVREAGSNLPLAAEVTAGQFNTSTDPSTGYYSMTVISGTYDMVVEATAHDPAYSNGIVAHDYQTVSQDFSLNPFCTYFSDDVESGNLGWTAQTPWAITTESSHSPTHSWTDSPGGAYGNNRNTSLTSPVLDLSGLTEVEVDFWHTYQMEAGYDDGYVEYSTGGGWTSVAIYNGSLTDWSNVQIRIPALDSQSNARIRFRFTSDFDVTLDGWHIDDIAITYRGASCMPVVAPEAEFTSNSPVLLGQPTNFTNQTTGSEPLTFEWDFGDSVGISTDINPSYTYSYTGTYSVTLEAYNSFGINSIIHTVEVQDVPVLFRTLLPIMTK
jgi:PKD repeat protein